MIWCVYLVSMEFVSKQVERFRRLGIAHINHENHSSGGFVMLMRPGPDYEEVQVWTVVENNGENKGLVSLPGGSADGDEERRFTALREMVEETFSYQTWENWRDDKKIRASPVVDGKSLAQLYNENILLLQSKERRVANQVVIEGMPHLLFLWADNANAEVNFSEENGEVVGGRWANLQSLDSDKMRKFLVELMRDVRFQKRLQLFLEAVSAVEESVELNLESGFVPPRTLPESLNRETLDFIMRISEANPWNHAQSYAHEPLPDPEEVSCHSHAQCATQGVPDGQNTLGLLGRRVWVPGARRLVCKDKRIEKVQAISRDGFRETERSHGHGLCWR